MPLNQCLTLSSIVMKKLICTTVIFLCCSMFAFTQFEWQQVSSPTSENLVSIWFTDPLTGFIASEDATLLKTSDGGSTWTSFFSMPGMYLNAIHFSDSDHGCMVGWYLLGGADSSLILVTGPFSSLAGSCPTS